MAKSQFIFIVGATGVGKTALSLDIAQHFSCPIVNFDSVQVYKYLDIGTAKPSASEFKQVPHYLFDFIEPPEPVTAARYLESVQKLFQDQPMEKAVFVGGSGFYLQALQKGLYPKVEVTEVVKTQVEQWMSEKSPTEVWQWIEERDPESAAKIHPNDHYRVRRTLEILLSQGLTRGELQKRLEVENHSPLPPHQSLTLGLYLPRQRLREQLEKRTDKMLSEGWISEVESLLAQGLENWPPMQSVGYKDVLYHLKKRSLNREALKEDIVTSTLQLAKKQMTWFRRQSDIEWFVSDDSQLALQRAQEWFREQDER